MLWYRLFVSARVASVCALYYDSFITGRWMTYSPFCICVPATVLCILVTLPRVNIAAGALLPFLTDSFLFEPLKRVSVPVFDEDVGGIRNASNPADDAPGINIILWYKHFDVGRIRFQISSNQLSVLIELVHRSETPGRFCCIKLSTAASTLNTFWFRNRRQSEISKPHLSFSQSIVSFSSMRQRKWLEISTGDKLSAFKLMSPAMTLSGSRPVSANYCSYNRVFDIVINASLINSLTACGQLLRPWFRCCYHNINSTYAARVDRLWCRVLSSARRHS